MFNLAIDSKLRGCDVVGMKEEGGRTAEGQGPQSQRNDQQYGDHEHARCSDAAGVAMIPHFPDEHRENLILRAPSAPQRPPVSPTFSLLDQSGPTQYPPSSRQDRRSKIASTTALPREGSMT